MDTEQRIDAWTFTPPGPGRADERVWSRCAVNGCAWRVPAHPDGVALLCRGHREDAYDTRPSYRKVDEVTHLKLRKLPGTRRGDGAAVTE
ncbi:MAG: hypothetical protein GEV09_01990 [Pseudonocardiaceae bacterium]|nr:hypothetical protein [Pseudonocardiaceae bacterium]